MRRTILRSLAVAQFALAPAPTQAASPDALDILGLRLGMAEAKVDAILSRQGVPASRITRTTSQCPDRHGCNVTILAPTADGGLTIRLIADATDPQASFVVSQIAYTLKGIAVGEVAMIKAPVVGRFGPPDQANPMTWCQTLSANRACPPDQPTLRFSPDTLTLVLTVGSTAERAN